MEDYLLRPRDTIRESNKKLYGEDWGYPDLDKDNDGSGDSDINTEFNLGDKIKTFNFKKLEKVNPYQGRKRIYEESEMEDYAESVEEGESEYDLENVIPAVEGDKILKKKLIGLMNGIIIINWMKRRKNLTQKGKE
jgi:hypothetical protein